MAWTTGRNITWVGEMDWWEGSGRSLLQTAQSRHSGLQPLFGDQYRCDEAVRGSN